MNRSVGLFATGLMLLLAAAAQAQPLNFAPFHNTGIYRVGEKAGWTVTLPAGVDTKAAKYRYEIKKNNFDVIKGGALDFTTGSATIEATVEEPAMLYATVTAEGAPPASAIHLGAAIAPTQLEPSVPRPPDFELFWTAKIQGLSLMPLNALITPVASHKDRVELSTVQLDCWGAHVQGYLAKPVKFGKFPALILYQPAGVYALNPDAAVARAAEGWLTFEVGPHDMPPTQASGIPPNYPQFGIMNRETSYFLGMYLRDARAVDYISNRSDWDGNTLVVMGSGMGGQQSLAAAALRQQVSAVIVNEPTGADTNGEQHGRQTGYPNWPSGNPQIMFTSQYYDTVNFASRIKAPVLASVGFLDTTAPPAGVWTMLNQLTRPKEVMALLDGDHQDAFQARVTQVLNTLLHGGEFIPNH